MLVWSDVDPIAGLYADAGTVIGVFDAVEFVLTGVKGAFLWSDGVVAYRALAVLAMVEEVECGQVPVVNHLRRGSQRDCLGFK